MSENNFKLAVTYAKLRLGSKEANLRAIEELIDDTAAGCVAEDGRAPDMMLLSESLYTRGNKKSEHFEETDGPLTRAVAEKARKHNCWIVFNYYELRASDGKKYNTNKMLDRGGRLVASYDKTFLPPDDIKFGCTAGPKDASNVRPIETEFGPIGMLICYDAFEKLGDRPFELFRLLSERGAKLTLVSSIGDYTPDTLKAGVETRMWTAHCGQDGYRGEGLFISNSTDPYGKCVAGVAKRDQGQRTYCSALIKL